MNHSIKFNGVRITALAGGVGGARLANGLAQVIDPACALSIIVNTGDDFDHLGMKISPDLDTVCYTLADLENPLTGWGRKDESWDFMQQIRQQGLPDWFNIGDKDRQTHLERTRRLNDGETLTLVTRSLCKEWGIHTIVLPMSDDSVPTIVDTVEFGTLGFQEYFVQHHCEPVVKGFIFPGHGKASPTKETLQAIDDADMIILCPSNPWVSLDPILMLDGVHQAVARKKVIGVSPIIGGKTIKGPAAKMYAELGITPSAANVAAHYKDILTGFVIDTIDQDLLNTIEEMGITCLVTDTVMTSTEKQAELAAKIVGFALNLKEK